MLGQAQTGGVKVIGLAGIIPDAENSIRVGAVQLKVVILTGFGIRNGSALDRRWINGCLLDHLHRNDRTVSAAAFLGCDHADIVAGAYRRGITAQRVRHLCTLIDGSDVLELAGFGFVPQITQLASGIGRGIAIQIQIGTLEHFHARRNRNLGRHSGILVDADYGAVTDHLKVSVFDNRIDLCAVQR